MELKGDGEPALVDVMKRTKSLRKQAILLKNPPAHDPQSNGTAERAVQEFKAELRALKLGLEQRLGATIDPKAAIIKWMVPHACEVINRYLVGQDGRTAYYRLHHRHFPQRILEFGESVLAKPLRKAKHNRKRSLRSKVLQATWLGVHPMTGEHRVALPHGGPVIRVRTVLRRPDSEKWSVDAVLAIKATPRVPNPRDERQGQPEHIKDTKGVEVGGDGSMLEETPVRSAESKRRNFRITDEVLKNFGYTEGCIGCDHKRVGLEHRGHTGACRDRLEQCMSADPDHVPALERRDNRRSTQTSEAPVDAPANADHIVEESEVSQATREREEREDGEADRPDAKRRRLAVIESSVKNAIGHLMRQGVPEAKSMCRREIIQSMLSELDQQWSMTVNANLKRKNKEKAKNVDTGVAEVYSPPRLVRVAEALGLGSGFSLDLTTADADGTPWDFTQEKARCRALNSR